VGVPLFPSLSESSGFPTKVTAVNYADSVKSFHLFQRVVGFRLRFDNIYEAAGWVEVSISFRE